MREPVSCPDAATGVQFHQVMDRQRGMAQAAFPYPAAWQVCGRHAPKFATGPGGIELYQVDTNQFFWSDDPRTDQRLSHENWTRFVKEQ